MTPIDLLLHVFFDELHRNVAGAFIHDLAAFGPGTRGELSLDFQFGQLRVIIGVGNRSGTKPVADGETDVVCGTDVANLVPMGVEEVLGIVVERPLGQNGSATRNDPGHTTGGVWDEPLQDGGVDGEVIDPLFGLLDEGVAVEFPGKVFDTSVNFFESLVDRNGADRNGRIA